MPVPADGLRHADPPIGIRQTHAGPDLGDDAGPPCVIPSRLRVVHDTSEAHELLVEGFDIPSCGCPARGLSPLHECCALTVALQQLSLGDIDELATRDFTGLIVHRQPDQFTGQA